MRSKNRYRVVDINVYNRHDIKTRTFETRKEMEEFLKTDLTDSFTERNAYTIKYRNGVVYYRNALIKKRDKNQEGYEVDVIGKTYTLLEGPIHKALILVDKLMA